MRTLDVAWKDISQLLRDWRSAAFLLADIGLKWWLAPIWREFLRALLRLPARIIGGPSR